MTFDKSERARQQLSWAGRGLYPRRVSFLPTGIQLRSTISLCSNVTADVRDLCELGFDIVAPPLPGTSTTQSCLSVRKVACIIPECL